MVEAMNLLRKEMKEDKSSYVQVVGQFLLQHLEANPSDVEKIMVKDKTIKGSIAEMRTEAEKQKVGNVAVLSDAEGFAAVLKYYGIKGGVTVAPVIQTTVAAAVTEKAEPSPVLEEQPSIAAKPSATFEASLDEFL